MFALLFSFCDHFILTGNSFARAAQEMYILISEASNGLKRSFAATVLANMGYLSFDRRVALGW